MADSVITPNVTYSHKAETYRVIGTLAVAASPGTYSAGGITCPLNIYAIKATRLPLRLSIGGQSGYVYKYIPGTTLANGKLKILTGAAAQSPLTELSAGAMPAGISGDVITFEGEWTSML